MLAVCATRFMIVCGMRERGGADVTCPMALGVDGFPKNPFSSDVMRNWRTLSDIGA